MDLNEIVKKITSGDIPTGVLAVVGIIALVFAVRTAGRIIKFFFFLIALALFAGAVWWHFHNRQ